MKEHILKLIELKPNLGYYDLVKIFGLSLDNLFKLLDIKNYKIKINNTIQIFDNNANNTYYENSDGDWIKKNMMKKED